MNAPMPEDTERALALRNAERKQRKREKNRERRARHYESQEPTFAAVDELVEALIIAFERGRCEPFLDNLPEDRRAKLREVTRRIEGKKLIACEREDKLR